MALEFIASGIRLGPNCGLLLVSGTRRMTGSPRYVDTNFLYRLNHSTKVKVTIASTEERFSAFFTDPGHGGGDHGRR